MNKDRRKKFRDWFQNALLPAKSSAGIVRVVGTILHMDSLLERLMPPETAKTTIVEDLKVYSTKKSAGQWYSVKYRAHNKDFSKILWPEKFSKQELIELRESYVAQGNAAGYSQEYLNIPIDETRAHFRRDDFRPMRKEDYEVNKNYYVTVDLAISQNSDADYSAFIVGGVDENNVLHIVNVVKDRLDGKQIVDMLLQLQRQYKPVAIGIEDMQVSKSIGPFLREEMQRTGVYATVLPLKPHKTDKITRSYPTQARMRVGSVRFDKEAEWYQDLEDEMCQFPRGKHDDLVDCMSYMGLMLDSFIEAQTKQEVEEEIYEDEMESSNFDLGRSSICGY